MTAGTDLRLLRAAVFTAVCVLLSAAGHATAAGAPVPLWALGTGCALVFAVAAPLAGRGRSLPTLTLALAAGQAALHVLFTAGHRPPTATGGPDPGGIRALARKLLCNDAAAGPLTHDEARRIVTDAGLAGQGSPGSAAHPGTSTPTPDTVPDGVPAALEAAFAQLSLPMLLGHLLAAASVGWLLHRGEAALRRLVRLWAAPARAAEELLSVRALRAAVRLLRALRHGLAPGDDPAVRITGSAPDRTAPPRPEPLAGAVTRRGPPVAHALDLAA